MEDSTFPDAYLTELRVMIRENAAHSAMFAQMLQEFVLDYSQRLEARMQGVDTASAEAQKFLDSYERLVADFENFAGEISFADALELKAMYENREYWEQRLAGLPPIPKQEKLEPLPNEEPTANKNESQAEAPQGRTHSEHSAAMHSARSSARHSSRPSQVSGPPPSRASAPSLRTIRQQDYEAAPSRPVTQTRRMPDPRPTMPGFGIRGSLAAPAA